MVLRSFRVQRCSLFELNKKTIPRQKPSFRSGTVKSKSCTFAKKVLQNRFKKLFLFCKHALKPKTCMAHYCNIVIRVSSENRKTRFSRKFRENLSFISENFFRDFRTIFAKIFDSIFAKIFAKTGSIFSRKLIDM